MVDWTKILSGLKSTPCTPWKCNALLVTERHAHNELAAFLTLPVFYLKLSLNVFSLKNFELKETKENEFVLKKKIQHTLKVRVLKVLKSLGVSAYIFGECLF